jgi:hypothetical protein
MLLRRVNHFGTSTCASSRFCRVGPDDSVVVPNPPGTVQLSPIAKWVASVFCLNRLRDRFGEGDDPSQLRVAGAIAALHVVVASAPDAPVT